MGFNAATYWVVGAIACFLAWAQVALWVGGSMQRIGQQRKNFKTRQQQFRRRLSTQHPRQAVAGQAKPGNWRGFREFRVDRIQKESSTTSSVYLIPVDDKPIVDFHPGQHLTLRFHIPGQNKPVVRCYSLSDRPGLPYYRITVKEQAPPPDQPQLAPGCVSSYVNRQLSVGQVLEVKAPAGEFFLDEDSDQPVVLLAGGIGITPMISMMEQITASNLQRPVVLFYGLRNGADHPFKARLETLAAKHPNIFAIVCYSNPRPQDQLGRDYQFQGYVGDELLKQTLKQPRFEFYLCGPPPFMRSLYAGLTAWGVKLQNIHYEAFGPASIKPAASDKSASSAANDSVPSLAVRFTRSELTFDWKEGSLLDLALQNQIEIDSGCRSGSCGSCATAIVSGEVEYPDGPPADCPAGHCLTCIARPKTKLELDA